MSIVWFFGALLGLLLVAVLINRLTGTRAVYLETLALERGEQRVWQDMRADFAPRPRFGRAVSPSFPRYRRHAILWTDRRIIVAPKVLFSSRHMVSHQILFTNGASPPGAAANEAAGEFFGGFYGRGFMTLLALSRSFDHVNGKDCVRIQPTEDSANALNVKDALIFSDDLDELRRSLEERR
jgi:hypothetical protein